MSTLIVGGDGQDGRILTNLVRGNGVEPYILTKQGVYLRDKIVIASSSLFEPNFHKFLVSSHIQFVYFFAAESQSSRDRSLKINEGDFQLNHDPVYLLLEHILTAMAQAGAEIKIFNASSSLIFAGTASSPQSEQTEIAPLEQYALLKVQNAALVERFSSLYTNIHHITGILYNHESVYRTSGFLSSHVINGAIDRKLGLIKNRLEIRSFEDLIDMSYAEDMVWNMSELMHSKANGTFVFSSGQSLTVGQFCDAVFTYLGLNFEEYCLEDKTDMRKQRTPLVGDCSKLRANLPSMKVRSSSDVVSALVDDWWKMRTEVHA